MVFMLRIGRFNVNNIATATKTKILYDPPIILSQMLKKDK